MLVTLALISYFIGITNGLDIPLGPVVDLGYAAFAGNSTSPSGLENSNVTFYGGIPYAKPPVGELRWRAPQPLDEDGVATGVMDARNWGPPCIQRPAVVGVGTEDCLTLNIWKPTYATKESKLPVAVYIHGGGFYANSPQGFPLYSWVAQSNSSLVGVSITYRLGLLGFLASKTLAEDGDLNAGLLDQRAALEWVQRHIGAFGGDPDQVTIYGESAGGASVLMQVVAYGGAKPVPFKQAVVQSIGFGQTRTDEEVESSFANVTKHVGCPGSGPDTMPCLRSASVGAIVSAINRNPGTRFDPVIDGEGGFLPDLPSQLVQSGKYATTVNIMGGHTTHDGRTFAGGRPEDFQSDEDVKRRVFSRWPRVTNETQDRALELYPLDKFESQYERAWTMAGEIVFVCEELNLLEAAIAYNISNVYNYRWNAPDTVLYNANPYLGSMHTSDLYYLFQGTNTFGNAGNTFTAFNQTESALSQEAIAYWTSFARHGSPSYSKLDRSPEWTPYTISNNGTKQRMVLSRNDDPSTGTANTIEDVPEDVLERCKFWMSRETVEQTRV